jgi:hypothetical protein
LKQLVTILIFLFGFYGIVVAQSNVRSGAMDSSENPEAKLSEKEKADVIPSKIKVWRLSDDYDDTISDVLDTLSINFHNYDPIYKQNISNTSLGFVGSPYVANEFFKRSSNPDFYFLRHLKAYSLHMPETKYYNTTTVFSTLEYSQNLSDNLVPEQRFAAFFTRNIDPFTNIGFRFDVLKMKGQYKTQGAHHKYLNVFASRNTVRYNGYLSLIKGGNKVTENGGISDASINTSLSPSSLLVKMVNGLESDITSLNVFTSHEYNIGKKSILYGVDSVSSEVFKPLVGFQYTAEYANYKRKVTEPWVETSFFDTTYISTNAKHIDSMLFSRFYHTFQIKALENAEKKFTFGKRAFIDNELVTATHPVAYGIRKFTYSNVAAGAEIYRSNSAFLNWKAKGRLVILGRNLGDAKLEGNIDKSFVIFKDSVLLYAEGWYADKSANIYEEHFVSNHYKWDNDFRKQHEVVIKGKLDIPSLRINGGLDYQLLSNYIYNNAQSIPDQYTNEFSVLGAWLKKDFVLWRFGWENKAVWQQSSDQTVLRIPTWCLHSRFYYSHYLFKVMQIQLGAEVYFHTAFKADKYNPATTMFYLQDEKEIGGFPVINVFANAKLKRTSAFVRMMHANSDINGYNFFTSPGYPLGQKVIRFGFLWSFYD